MSFWTRAWGKETGTARVAGAHWPPPQHGSNTIHGCWSGREQGCRAQGALSRLPEGQEGQESGGEGDEEGESLEGFTVNQQL